MATLHVEQHISNTIKTCFSM